MDETRFLKLTKFIDKHSLSVCVHGLKTSCENKIKDMEVVIFAQVEKVKCVSGLFKFLPSKQIKGHQAQLCLLLLVNNMTRKRVKVFSGPEST